MRILATAFCCKPNSGSESAFAWWWATTTAQDHDVTVITVEAQRERIEAEMADRDDLDRLKFVYVKGPDEVSASGSSHRFERLHQYLWQLRAIPTARRLARKWRPDAAQHVSTGTWRQPSCLAFTNLNFAMGPLAGSEELPAKFARHFGMRAFLWESFRSSLIRVARIDPLVRFTLRRADIIIIDPTNPSFKQKLFGPFASGRTATS